MLNFKKSLLAATVVASTLTATNVSATSIAFNYDPAEFADAKGQQALAGFQQAADFWESIFSDDVTINLDIGFSALDPNIIGSTSSNRAVFLYNDVALAMVNDATSGADNINVNSLTCENQGPNICARSFLDQEADGTNGAVPGLDNDGTGDNLAFALTQANAKALGFTTDSWGGAFNASDGRVTFSSNFSFDFDTSDGIDANKMDFVGVAIHEIGHALGFTSGVDLYDLVYNSGLYNGVDLDGLAVGSALDLFRFSEESVNDYGVGTLDWRPGAETYFSIDGGITSIAQFSTGVYGGDNHQASHFKDNQGIGIMDPTISFGEFGEVSAIDMLAFDVVGWDLSIITDVPEPTSLALFGLTTAGLFASRRRKLKPAK